MNRNEKKNLKNQKKTLDRILSLVSAGILAATLVLDMLDRKKKPAAVVPAVDPEETREKVREQMQEQYDNHAAETMTADEEESAAEKKQG